ncbi:mitochondrial mRNA pseudouridine synthase Rpusd3 [Lingula anatina]|uniref:Mitochondrial mRNA pseudouridine synthase Rpusd3 n=1 Tax=Lingula anatina TaxID=7574 RepID=A0A2R2MT56_LINAN|nr:mitochondrial mRNA pseudouridine synthase Rpusd3 [Lingula anatina]|eukprot:XP_023933207.1 mitochondrial mRNA pseudouridine synthase Rpusd3 [Lingula anatina]
MEHLVKLIGFTGSISSRTALRRGIVFKPGPLLGVPKTRTVTSGPDINEDKTYNRTEASLKQKQNKHYLNRNGAFSDKTTRAQNEQPGKHQYRPDKSFTDDVSSTGEYRRNQRVQPRRKDNFKNSVPVHGARRPRHDSEFMAREREMERQRVKTRKENKNIGHTKQHPYLERSLWTNSKALTKHLLQNVLYQDKHYIAFNKPADVPIFTPNLDKKKKRDAIPEDPIEHPSQIPSVMSVLPELKDSLNQSHMFLTCYQKDCRESQFHMKHSGVLLFVKSLEADKALRKYAQSIVSQKLESQTFWAVTVGIPTKDEGVEELGLERRELQKNVLSFVTRNCSLKARKNRTVIVPTIAHTVLAKNNEVGSALVQLKPTNNKWDCLQVHLARMLSPVLGDHTYSSRVQYMMGKPTVVNAAVATPKPQILPELLESQLRMRFIR